MEGLCGRAAPVSWVFSTVLPAMSAWSKPWSGKSKAEASPIKSLSKSPVVPAAVDVLEGVVAVCLVEALGHSAPTGTRVSMGLACPLGSGPLTGEPFSGVEFPGGGGCGRTQQKQCHQPQEKQGPAAASCGLAFSCRLPLPPYRPGRPSCGVWIWLLVGGLQDLPGSRLPRVAGPGPCRLWPP